MNTDDIQIQFIKLGAEYLNISVDEFKSRMKNNESTVIKDWNNKKSIEDFYKTTDAYIYGLVSFNDGYRVNNILHPLIKMKNLSILDYGGGSGIIGMSLASDNKVYYYDLESKTKNFAKFVNSKIQNKIIFTDSEDDAFSKPIDMAICVDVLEHLENPMKLVKRITEKLPTYGFFLTTGLNFSIGAHTPMHLPENLKYKEEFTNYMTEHYNLWFYHPTKNETIHLFSKKEPKYDIQWKEHKIKEYDKNESFDDIYYKYLGCKEKHVCQASWLVDNFDFDTFLEIGPGNCGMLENMNTRGKKVVGVEYIKSAIEKFAPPDIKIVNAPVWDMSEIKEQSDMVFCFAVLQLIPMDKREQAVKEIYRLTKKYALLVIPHMPQKPVPGEEWVVSPEVYEKNKDKYKTLVQFETLEYWTKLFEQVGFKKIKTPKLMPLEGENYFLFEK